MLFLCKLVQSDNYEKEKALHLKELHYTPSSEPRRQLEDFITVVMNSESLSTYPHFMRKENDGSVNKDKIKWNMYLRHTFKLDKKVAGWQFISGKIPNQ